METAQVVSGGRLHQLMHKDGVKGWKNLRSNFKSKLALDKKALRPLADFCVLCADVRAEEVEDETL